MLLGDEARILGSGARTEYIDRVPKWPSSVAHTIFLAKYALKKCFEYLESGIESVHLRLDTLRTCYINNMYKYSIYSVGNLKLHT